MRAELLDAFAKRISMPVRFRGRVYPQSTPVNRITSETIPELAESSTRTTVKDELIAEIAQRLTSLGSRFRRQAD
jgi:hypothetical protein